MSILIFANGEMPASSTWLTPYLENATHVIAADGGTRHLLVHNRFPDTIIGDFDSFSSDWVMPKIEAEIKILAYPKDKDETDLELALAYATSEEAWAEEDLLIFGALGGRLDMTLGNVGLLANPQWSHRNIRLISSTQQAWLIRDKCDLVGRIGDMVSLLPWGGDVEIAGTAGLKWTITHDTLRIGTTLGISNELVCEHAKIKVKSGQLLCVHTTQ